MSRFLFFFFSDFKYIEKIFMKIHTSKKSKEKQASAKKIHFSKSLFIFLILYCIAVLTGKGKFNVQIAAGDLNSEVEHIGVGKTA